MVILNHQLNSEALCDVTEYPCFYSVRLLASRPTSKLEDHSWSAVHDCLFNIFAANLHIWRLTSPSTTLGDALCGGDRIPRMGKHWYPVCKYQMTNSKILLYCIGHIRFWLRNLTLLDLTERDDNNIIPSYCHLPVSCWSLVDRCGSLGSCKPRNSIAYGFWRFTSPFIRTLKIRILSRIDRVPIS